MLFPIGLSRAVSMAGRNTTTISMDKKVPRPRSIPMSRTMGLEDVAAKVKPAAAIVVADTRIERNELPIALWIASFFEVFFLLRI